MKWKWTRAFVWTGALLVSAGLAAVAQQPIDLYRLPRTDEPGAGGLHEVTIGSRIEIPVETNLSVAPEYQIVNLRVQVRGASVIPGGVYLVRPTVAQPPGTPTEIRAVLTPRAPGDASIKVGAINPMGKVVREGEYNVRVVGRNQEVRQITVPPSDRQPQ